MKLLPSHSISNEILEIIIDAKERLVLVSPYVDFQKWPRLSSALIQAKSKGVQIDFYVRLDADNVKSWEQLESIGLKPILVPNLHAKFYYNECSGVISSMNLLTSSFTNAIEIGCKIDDKLGILELDRFIEKYIAPTITEERPDELDLYVSKEKFPYVLSNVLSNELQRDCKVFFNNGEFTIKVGNESFFLSVDKVHNSVRLVSILSTLQEEHFRTGKINGFGNGFFILKSFPPSGKYYAYLEGTTHQRFSNGNFDYLRVPEKKRLLQEISQFIQFVMKFKESIR